MGEIKGLHYNKHINQIHSFIGNKIHPVYTPEHQSKCILATLSFNYI